MTFSKSYSMIQRLSTGIAGNFFESKNWATKHRPQAGGAHTGAIPARRAITVPQGRWAAKNVGTPVKHNRVRYDASRSTRGTSLGRRAGNACWEPIQGQGISVQ